MSAQTIAAIATPPGTGGVCVIRVSGKEAPAIARRLAGRLPGPRQAALATFRDAQGGVVDQGLLLYFPAPHSFTGEDVIELHGHGGIAVSRALLQAVLDAGARPAEPGEFSHRAFLNDKMDLVQAEAVADLIAARSQAAVQAANRVLQGDFSRIVNRLAEALLHLRRDVEAALDFSEEEIDFLQEDAVETRLAALLDDMARLIAQSGQGRLLNDGIRLAIVGKPNAGKSSLLNALAGEDRAIVSPQAGTTRDIVREHLVICGIPVIVLDTAGLRESDDLIEQEGVRRAQAAMADADMIIRLIDGSSADVAQTVAVPAGKTVLDVWNKADCVQEQADDARLWISAKTGQGIGELKRQIARLAGQENHEETPFIARARHMDALNRAQSHMHDALVQMRGLRAAELMAEDLRRAHDALGEITGKIGADDLLGSIFASFCIGK